MYETDASGDGCGETDAVIGSEDVIIHGFWNGNNRESFLPGIARSYIDLADDHEGITKVTLKTNVEISEKNRNRFIEIIERDLDTKADLEEIVDEEIAGGYILKVEDLYVDASLKTQLRKIRRELIKE